MCAGHTQQCLACTLTFMDLITPLSSVMYLTIYFQVHCNTFPPAYSASSCSSADPSLQRRGDRSYRGQGEGGRKAFLWENGYFSMQSRSFLCHLTLNHFPVRANIINLFLTEADPSQIEAELSELRTAGHTFCLLLA